jgi:hypothetical protein
LLFQHLKIFIFAIGTWFCVTNQVLYTESQLSVPGARAPLPLEVLVLTVQGLAGYVMGVCILIDFSNNK